MKFKIIASTLALLIVISVAAQKKALESISESDLKAHLEFIASDYMQGRDFGTKTPGLEITAEYLRTQCIRLGLKEGSSNYFQRLDMISVGSDWDNTSFKIMDDNGNLQHLSKNIFAYPGSMKSDTVTGEIVFLGYGWYDDETGYDAYNGLDLKDKIVIIMTRNRETVINDNQPVQALSLESRKFSRALMQGARAVVLISDPMNTDNRLFSSLKEYLNRVSLQHKDRMQAGASRNIFFAETAFVDELLKDSGKSVSDYQKQINETGKPVSVEFEHKKAEIIVGKKIENANLKNVVAVLEGSDPKLKDECIVLTAHYDHVGVAANGEINNGADDNGSGTVALLEVAEAFTKLKNAPKRSIVFAWVTAEEKGLFGSAYYSQNPVFPLEQTLVNLNMDMIGRSAEKDPPEDANEYNSLAGPDLIYLISGEQSTELMEISNDVCKELDLHSSLKLTKPFLTRSDYYNFYKYGIPVIGVSTGLHPDYHRPSDELDKIDYNKMKRVANYIFLVAEEVANRKERIVVDNPAQLN